MFTKWNPTLLCSGILPPFQVRPKSTGGEIQALRGTKFCTSTKLYPSILTKTSAAGQLCWIEIIGKKPEKIGPAYIAQERKKKLDLYKSNNSQIRQRYHQKPQITVPDRRVRVLGFYIGSRWSCCYPEWYPC